MTVSPAVIATPDAIIDEMRNGRMVVLIDDEDRENEGDLVIPAQMATPDAINFMATHGRGLVCLALTRARADTLGLRMMSPANGARHETAFTTSIEAREGVTTGISTADRARTIAVAIDASRNGNSIVTPGHVFPLVARDGGVLIRAGHTEAAVDLARLAGLNPAGVICEIMNDDGTMSRLDDLLSFAERHGLKIGTIRDLIGYRLRHDPTIRLTAEAGFASRCGGPWTARSFINTANGSEQLALTLGTISGDRPTLVRMHAFSMIPDVFFEDSARGGLLERAMRVMANEGSGVIVIVNRPLPDGLRHALEVRAGTAVARDPHMLGDYGGGAQILAMLGVHDMVLLTDSDIAPRAMEGFGLRIVDRRALTHPEPR